MDLKCRKCSDNEFYLQQKGMQVGAYCKNCGSWIKWVGKKEIPIYTRRGAKVFPEGMVIKLKMQEHKDFPALDLGYENLGVSIEQLESLEKKEKTDKYNYGNNNEVIEALPWEVELEHENMIQQEVERRVQLELNKNKNDVPHILEEGVEKEEFCPICTGMPIEMEDKSKVDMVLYSDVLTITDLSGVQVLGFWKINYCPNCGRKLK